MYFKVSIRTNPETGEPDGYYSLVESYRNADNRVCHRTILNVGFINDATPEQLNKIQKQLTEKCRHRASLFEESPEEDPVVKKYVQQLWERIVASTRLDITPEAKLSRMVNVDTLTHGDVREIGAEHICYQTWEQLQLTPLLLSVGFTVQQTQLACTQVISRAVYPASELETARWIRENSGVCELTGYDMDAITKDKLYIKVHYIFMNIKMLLKSICRSAPMSCLPWRTKSFCMTSLTPILRVGSVTVNWLNMAGARKRGVMPNW